MGVGIWNSVDGPPLAVTPVGRVGLRLSNWAWARVSLASLGSQPRVETAYGSAAITVRQTPFTARLSPLSSSGASDVLNRTRNPPVSGDAVAG